MYARVVRFTDVDPDHLAGRLDGIEAAGPPVDIPAKGIQIFHDEDQRTAVVIQLFETADDMAAAEGPLLLCASTLLTSDGSAAGGR